MARMIALAVSLLVVSMSLADDWPQWRGPNRNGVSKEKGLLAKWPEEGPKLAWKVTDAGLGFSSFAVRDGKVYTLGSRGADEIILAYDAAFGKELWSAKIGEIFTFESNTWGDGPRSTPTLDGNLLFALGGQGDLVCVDLAKKGAEIWRKNLIKDFGGEVMTEWGYTESPLVDGDRVVVTPGGKKGLMASLDKKTGALLWRSAEETRKATYSSAVAADINDIRQYIQLSYSKSDGGFVSGIAAKDGKRLWQASVSTGGSIYICPTPIVDGNLVYVTYGEGSAGLCRAFEIDKAMKPIDLYGSKEQKVMKNSLGGVVLVDGKIYGYGGKAWVCQDLKTGKALWSKRDPHETISATTLAAGDMLYLVNDEGEIGLAKASPAAFEVVSEFKLPQLSAYTKTRPTSIHSKVWNYPVVANGKLYLRDCELIYCYEIAANNAPKNAAK